MNGGPRRTGGLRLSRGFGWAARYRRRRAVLTLTAARVISDTTRRRPARRVPPEVEAGARKAVFGVLADGQRAASSRSAGDVDQAVVRLDGGDVRVRVAVGVVVDRPLVWREVDRQRCASREARVRGVEMELGAVGCVVRVTEQLAIGV